MAPPFLFRWILDNLLDVALGTLDRAGALLLMATLAGGMGFFLAHIERAGLAFAVAEGAIEGFGVNFVIEGDLAVGVFDHDVVAGSGFGNSLGRIGGFFFNFGGNFGSLFGGGLSGLLRVSGSFYGLLFYLSGSFYGLLFYFSGSFYSFFLNLGGRFGGLFLNLGGRFGGLFFSLGTDFSGFFGYGHSGRFGCFLGRLGLLFFAAGNDRQGSNQQNDKQGCSFHLLSPFFQC